MFKLRGFSVSASTILQLYINFPHWRFALCLRFLALLLAVATITCDAIILLWKPIPRKTAWWNFESLNNGIPFIPCLFSIIWSIASIVKLFTSRKPFHPGADLSIDLFISLLLAPTIVFALLGPRNQWRFDGLIGLSTPARKLELAIIVGLGLLFVLHFTSFIWSCRRLYTQRRHRRRENRDRNLSTTIRAKLGSMGTSIEPMPSRQYHQTHAQTHHIKPPPAIKNSNPSLTTSQTAVSPLYPKPSYSSLSLGAKSLDIYDVERGLKPWISTRKRYYEISDDGDEEEDVPPPTPPPKPREDRLRQVPYPSSIPDCVRLDGDCARSPNWRGGGGGGLERPKRAYSISSYYYDRDESF